MKTIATLISYAMLAAIVSYPSPSRSEDSVGVQSGNVVIVTAKNMNANVSLREINELMQAEVATFSKALQKCLEADGRGVTLKEFESASGNDIALEIAKAPKRPEILLQAYWTIKQDKSMYIMVDALRIQYRDSGRSMTFAPLDRKEYLSIGLSAKPTDSPENHATNYHQRLREIEQQGTDHVFQSFIGF